QGSLDLSPWSVPDPDVAVVQGSPRNASPDNPTTALLLVEVSETTLAYDRSTKASLYARAGIADYWIVNLVDRQVGVLRNPRSRPLSAVWLSLRGRTDPVPRRLCHSPGRPAVPDSGGQFVTLSLLGVKESSRSTLGSLHQSRSTATH